MRNSVHGVTTETSKRLLLDAGKVVLNYGLPEERDLGATLGGNTFTVETEYKDIRPDNVRGPVKGLRRITDVTATLTVNMFEMTRENIMQALPGSSFTPVLADGTAPVDPAVPTHEEIRRVRNLQDLDYLDNIAIIATISGSGEPVIIIIENALNDGSLELGFEDKEEASTEIAYKAHFNPETLEVEPWLIRYPIIPTV